MGGLGTLQVRRYARWLQSFGGDLRSARVDESATFTDLLGKQVVWLAVEPPSIPTPRHSPVSPAPRHSPIQSPTPGAP